MPYVLSRLAAAQDYAIYDQKTANNLPRTVETIRVLGGAGVADRKTLVTPLGVVTEITSAQATALKAHPVFRQHQAAGVVEIVTKKPEPDKAPETLDEDPAAPVTPQDYQAEGRDAPETGAPEA